ncbi:hypothetical protein [Actinokineospora sp.]
MVLLAVAARLPESPVTSVVHAMVGATMIWLAAALWTSVSRKD